MLYNMRAQIAHTTRLSRRLAQGQVICPTCRGDGDIAPQEHFGQYETCYDCDGTGTVAAETAKRIELGY